VGGPAFNQWTSKHGTRVAGRGTKEGMRREGDGEGGKVKPLSNMGKSTKFTNATWIKVKKKRSVGKRVRRENKKFRNLAGSWKALLLLYIHK